jgi:hypothetical protein
VEGAHDTVNLWTFEVFGCRRRLTDGFPHDHALDCVSSLDTHAVVVEVSSLTVEVVPHL